MTKTNTERSRVDGRYEHRMDRVCKCGHTKGVHLDGGRHPCDNENWGDGKECGCSRFAAK